MKDLRVYEQAEEVNTKKTFSSYDVKNLVSTLQDEKFWGELIIKVKDGKIPTILKQESLSPSIH